MSVTKKSSRVIDRYDERQIDEIKGQVLRHPKAQIHLHKLRKDGIDLDKTHRGILGFIILAALSPAKKGKRSAIQRSHMRRARSLPSRLSSLADELEDAFWHTLVQADLAKGCAPKGLPALPNRMRETAKFLKGKLSELGGRGVSERDMWIRFAEFFVQIGGSRPHDDELHHLMSITQVIAGKTDDPPPDPEARRSRRYRMRHGSTTPTVHRPGPRQATPPITTHTRD